MQQAGFPVVYTRTTDVYQRPIDKAQLANESNGDYFVSFHRNASPDSNTYSGVQTLVYRDAGMPAQIAGSINKELEAVGFNNLVCHCFLRLCLLEKCRIVSEINI